MKDVDICFVANATAKFIMTSCNAKPVDLSHSKRTAANVSEVMVVCCICCGVSLDQSFMEEEERKLIDRGVESGVQIA